MFGLKHIELNKIGKYTYFYYRERHDLPRFRLPDPVKVDEAEFLQSWLVAREQTKEFKESQFHKTKSLKLEKGLRLYLQALRPSLTTNTTKQYKNFCKRLTDHFGNIPVAAIGHEHLDEFILSIEGAQSANQLLGFCKRAWKWFREHRLIPDNIIEEVPGREIRTAGFQPWSEQEVAHYKDVYGVGGWPRLVLEVLLNTGCRISDALALGPRNVYQDVLTYRAKKTGLPVNITLSEEFRQLIGHVYSDRMAFIYHPRTQKPFDSYDQFYPMFKRICVAIDIQKTAHGLRKTVATRYANQGYSASQIMAVMGWDRLSTAEIYVKKADKRLLGISASSDFNSSSQKPPKIKK